jgi:putative hydrolase of the HAD superfamily
MARAINPAIPEELVRSVAEYRMGRFARSILEPPVRSIEALRGLRRMGKKIALVSNADVGEIRDWNKSPLAPFFDCAVFSCDVGAMKPDPRIFQEALDRLGENPRDCLFVGDGGAEELRAARELGFITVMVTGYININPEKSAARRAHADYVVGYVDELLHEG